MNGQKGFTLAELLIVVAIIATLVAISIPIFSAQLENSREATDAANIRSAYAEVAATALSNSKVDASATVVLTQQQDGWQNESIENIAGIDPSSMTISTTEAGKKAIVVSYAGSKSGYGKITIGGQEVKSTSVTTSK